MHTLNKTNKKIINKKVAPKTKAKSIVNNLDRK